MHDGSSKSTTDYSVQLLQQELKSIDIAKDSQATLFVNTSMLKCVRPQSTFDARPTKNASSEVDVVTRKGFALKQYLSEHEIRHYTRQQ